MELTAALEVTQLVRASSQSWMILLWRVSSIFTTFELKDIRLAGLISIVGIPCLARCNGSVINQFEQVLAVPGDDRKLLAVFTESIELVSKGGLELLTGDVGKLSFGDERLGFGPDKFLFEDDNTRAVGLFVFKLGDLIGNLLLA